MIRASNQFSPKTKVVDLLFLYNFYFGQISSFLYENLSFNWSNSSKNNLNEETVHLLCSTLCRPDAIPASGRRRATPRVGNRAPAPLFSSRTPWKLLCQSPFLFVRARVHDELSRASRARRAGHGSPPRLDSSHPELRSLAVHPLRPPTRAAEPLTGRNRASV